MGASTHAGARGERYRQVCQAICRTPVAASAGTAADRLAISSRLSRTQPEGRASMNENYWTSHLQSRRTFLRGLGAAAGLAALAPLAACSSTKQTAKPTASAAARVSPSATGTATATRAAAPIKGGTLTLALGSDLTTFDPLTYADGYSAYAIRNMADTLVRYTHDLQPAPGLAKRWEVSTDGTAYVFHLQPNVSFQDGTPFDAEAVRYNLNRTIQDKISPWHSDLADVQALSVLDPLSIKLTLGHPYAPFLSKLLLGSGIMVSPMAVEKLGDKLKTDFTGAGAGPWKFGEWLKDDHFTAVRNERYWDKDASGTQLPYLDKLVLTPVPDENLRLSQLRTGAVDALSGPVGGPPAKDIAAITADPSLTYQQEPGLAAEGLVLQTQKPPFDEKEVRQALAYAIDREAIVQSVLYGAAVANDTVIPAIQPGSDPSYHPYRKQDLGKAKQLLQQAGQGRVSFTLQIAAGAPQVQQMAELIKDQISAAGFDLQIQAMDFPTQLANAKKGAFQANTLAWTGFVDPDGNVAQLFGTGGGTNYSGYSNPTLDGLMQKGRQTLDTQARIPIYQQINRTLADDLPVVVLYNPVSNYVTRKAVQNFPIGVASIIRLTGVWKSV
jgi:peptide/nickel transport system substrate-binding protein